MAFINVVDALVNNVANANAPKITTVARRTILITFPLCPPIHRTAYSKGHNNNQKLLPSPPSAPAGSSNMYPR